MNTTETRSGSVKKKKLSFERIAAFRTSDGKVFETEKDAQEHLDNIELLERIRNFVDAHGYSGMCTSDIVDMLYENSDDLIEVLQGEE
jgi:hypothetical protein